MLFEDAFAKIAREFGYAKFGPHAWIRCHDEFWVCMNVGRDQFNHKKGIHHPSIGLCFKNYLTDLTQPPKPHHFPISIWFHYLVSEEYRDKFLCLVNDDCEELVGSREIHLRKVFLGLIRKGETIFESRDTIVAYMKSSEGGHMVVMGPALELKGKVWNKGWPPLA